MHQDKKTAELTVIDSQKDKDKGRDIAYFKPKDLLPYWVEKRMHPTLLLRLYALIGHYRILRNLSTYHNAHKKEIKGKHKGATKSTALMKRSGNPSPIEQSLLLLREKATALIEQKYNSENVESFLSSFPKEVALASYVGSVGAFTEIEEDVFYEDYPQRGDYAKKSSYQSAVNGYLRKKQAHDKKIKRQRLKREQWLKKSKEVAERKKVKAAFLQAKQKQAEFKKSLPYYQELLSRIIKGANELLYQLRQKPTTQDAGGVYVGRRYHDKPLGKDSLLALYFNRSFGAKGLDQAICNLIGSGHLSQTTTPLKAIDYFCSQISESGVRQAIALDGQCGFSLKDKDFNNHLLGIGGSGSGKTELILLLVEYLMNNKKDSPMLLIEPHGPLCKQIVALCKDKDRLVYLTGDYLSKGSRFCYNPLFFTHPEKEELTFNYRMAISNRATNLKLAFGVALPKGEFSTQMQNLLYNCLVVLLHTNDTSLFHLIDLMRVVGKKGEMKSPYAEIVTDFYDQEIKAYFAHTFTQNTLIATRNAVVTRLEGMFASESSKSLFFCEQSSFDLKDLFFENKIVLVSAETMNFTSEAIKLLGSMLTTEYDEWLDVRAARFGVEGNPNAYLFMDEAGMFLTEHIAAMADERRKFGAAMCIFAQRRGQFIGNVWESITTNANTFMVGRGGHFDKICKDCSITGVNLKGEVGEFATKDFNGSIFRLRVDSRLVKAKEKMNLGIEPSFMASQLKSYYQSVHYKPSVYLDIPTHQDEDSGEESTQNAKAKTGNKFDFLYETNENDQ